MTIPATVLGDAAIRLHNYLLREHWNSQVIEGPDSGIRFNSRIGRFIKSYLSFVPWSDRYIYMQAQAYWILDNWLLIDLLDDPRLDRERCREVALGCSEYVLTAQRPEGYWEYPNPEWKGRIATVEGNYAALGLLESYSRTRNEALLASAQRWYAFLIKEVGFQGDGKVLAINYFSNVRGGMVPNNTASLLRFVARLAQLTGDKQYLSRCSPMVAWLNHVQLDSGELPYSVVGLQGGGRTHFLCYQYNAFEFLNLAKYYHITADQAIWPVLNQLAAYLATGITLSGAARYDCHREQPEVAYYTAAVGAALGQATLLGLGDYRALTDRAYQRVLSQQRVDGGLRFFSRGNYGVLADRRSYPRNLAMILNHLLLELQTHVPQIEPDHARAVEIGSKRLFERGEFEGAAPQESSFPPRIAGETTPFSNSF